MAVGNSTTGLLSTLIGPTEEGRKERALVHLRHFWLWRSLHPRGALAPGKAGAAGSGLPGQLPAFQARAAATVAAVQAASRPVERSWRGGRSDNRAQGLQRPLDNGIT